MKLFYYIRAFFITIRENADILFEKILSNNDEWLKKIIDYALFDLQPPEDFSQLNRIHQINHNACNFLADTKSHFLSLLKGNEEFDGVDLYQQSIKKFISPTNKTNRNPMFAGHFLRFFNNIMNNNFFDNYQNEIIENIIPFLALKSQILAYQQLFVDMLEFYNYKEDELIVYLIIQNILQVSFKSVKYIQEFYRETERFLMIMTD